MLETSLRYCDTRIVNIIVSFAIPRLSKCNDSVVAKRPLTILDLAACTFFTCLTSVDELPFFTTEACSNISPKKVGYIFDNLPLPQENSNFPNSPSMLHVMSTISLMYTDHFIPSENVRPIYF